MKRILPWVLLAFVVLFALWWANGGQFWFAEHTGTDYCPALPPGDALTTCRAYGFWSGFGSDLGEFALIAGIWANATLLWRKHTCDHSWWCWRHPAYQLEGTQFTVCGHHFPGEVPATAKAAVRKLRERGHIYLGKQPGKG